MIPDVIDVAEVNDFDLGREWYDWVGQDPFQGLPHEVPRNHIEASRMMCLNTTCSARSFLILSLEMHLAGSVNYSQDL